MDELDDFIEMTALDRVVGMQDALVSYATGGGFDGGDHRYKRLRKEIIHEFISTGNVPDFVRRCRDMNQFWQFIKHKHPTYQERREYLWDAFRPLVDQLEFSHQHPAEPLISSAVENFSPDKVHFIWKKAIERRVEDPEGAITAAKALVESTCKHILDDLGVEYPEHSEITKLWALVAEELELAPSKYSEKPFKTILGSCQKIVDTLAELRNKLGDAHGTGRRQVKPSPRHAELAVNLAGTMASFLIATAATRQGA